MILLRMSSMKSRNFDSEARGGRGDDRALRSSVDLVDAIASIFFDGAGIARDYSGRGCGPLSRVEKETLHQLGIARMRNWRLSQPEMNLMPSDFAASKASVNSDIRLHHPFAQKNRPLIPLLTHLKALPPTERVARKLRNPGIGEQSRSGKVPDQLSESSRTPWAP